MEAMRQSWTDDRLDEFGRRIDERFDRVEERFARVDQRFEEFDVRLGRFETRTDNHLARIDSRLDSMGRALVIGSIAISSTMIAGFGAMVAVIATKL
jgi:hypothetical protein